MATNRALALRKKGVFFIRQNRCLKLCIPIYLNNDCRNSNFQVGDWIQNDAITFFFHCYVLQFLLQLVCNIKLNNVKIIFLTWYAVFDTHNTLSCLISQPNSFQKTYYERNLDLRLNRLASSYWEPFLKIKEIFLIVYSYHFHCKATIGNEFLFVNETIEYL